jgi:hypothetical protein
MSNPADHRARRLEASVAADSEMPIIVWTGASRSALWTEPANWMGSATPPPMPSAGEDTVILEPRAPAKE